MSQFTRTVITGSPRTVPCQVKRCAATWPGAIGPIGESIGCVATAISCFVLLLGVEREAERVGDHVDRLQEAARRAAASIGLFAACSGVFPNSITSRPRPRRAVGADVGELLRAHVRDRARERRDHQREALGDAARVDAGAVQRRRRPCGRPPRGRRRSRSGTGRTSRAASRRSCPTRGSAITSFGLRHERAVQHAVGVEREQRVDVVGRAHADRRPSPRARRRPARSSRRCAPSSRPARAPGAIEDALDRRAPDAARRPLDHAILHVRPSRALRYSSRPCSPAPSPPPHSCACSPARVPRSRHATPTSRRPRRALCATGATRSARSATSTARRCSSSPSPNTARPTGSRATCRRSAG